MQIIVSFTKREDKSGEHISAFYQVPATHTPAVPHYPRVIYQTYKRDIINIGGRGPQVLIFNYPDHPTSCLIPVSF